MKKKVVEARYYFPRENKHLYSIFLFLFFFLLQTFFMYKTFEITTARNLKFGDIISLYIKLCSSIFGGTKLCGLGKRIHNL